MRTAHHAAKVTHFAGCRPQWRAIYRRVCGSPGRRRYIHDGFQVGDSVLLKAKNRDDRPFWSGPLKEDGVFESHQGNIPHKDIIGKTSRERIDSSAGRPFRVYRPSLAEHCIFTPRVVTPIYPAECNAIVSLLDIHVSPPGPEGRQASRPPLEILEAGTGHGALTLHLARAIHAANPALPPRMYLEDNKLLHAERSGELSQEDSTRDAWKQRRGAVIHSVDISSKHLKTAKRTVRTFRQGIYSNDVDFHCADVPSFIAAEFQRRGTRTPFLSHIILDMPDAHTQLPNVVAAMRPNSTVLIFCPQVTQILDAVKTSKLQGLPLALDQVVELGMGLSGGRHWDVRITPNTSPKSESASAATNISGLSLLQRLMVLFGGSGGSETTKDRNPQEWFEVCKPKLGDRIVNGGFVGLWTKIDA